MHSCDVIVLAVTVNWFDLAWSAGSLGYSNIISLMRGTASLITGRTEGWVKSNSLNGGG